MNGERQNVATERPWSALMGYRRSVRVGPPVEIAGTTSVSSQGEALHPGDAFLQTCEALRINTAALAELEAQPKDVIRTRLFGKNVDHWEDIARARGEVFADLGPASSMVEVERLLFPGLLIEIEAKAFLTD